MPYSDYIGGTKLKFDRDESGTRPPPVYLKSATRRMKLDDIEKESVQANIVKARDDIDDVVGILRNSSVGPRAQQVIDGFLKNNPSMTRESLAKYSKNVADKLYTSRINISVTDQVSASERRPAKYQRARHRRAIGRVQFSADPNVLNVEMTRSAVSAPDGAQNILGTVASSVRQSGRPGRTSDFVQFASDLIEAHERDAQPRSREPDKTASRGSDDSVYVAAARVAETHTLLPPPERPADISRMAGEDVPLYASETTAAIHAYVDRTGGAGAEDDSGKEHNMEHWYEKQLETAEDEKDLNAIDKRMEDHQEVEKQIGYLFDKSLEYSREDRRAITNALLEGTDEYQHKVLRRSLQVRERDHVAYR